MKVAFDVSDLCANAAAGTTRYTRELAGLLPTMATNDSWLYLAPCRPSGDEKSAALREVRWISSPWQKYWTQLRLPTELYRLKPDVLFMPIQQIPFFRPGKIRTVAVVHDLAIHRYPQMFTYKDWFLLHVFSAYVARYADHLIAVSSITAQDIAYYYGRTENVRVIHHGVDDAQFHLPTQQEREHGWEALRSADPRIRAPYLLYVGQIQPRKNLIRLIEAFEQLHPHEPDLRLVIAGSHGWLQEPILQRVEKSPFKGSILVTGRVPESLLPALYWHAQTLVLPSLYEGFGLPVLEAFACGCPVVCSNSSSLPEVAGDAAILIDPSNTESMSSGIREALRRREELINKGLRRVQHFTWERTAQQTLDVISGRAW